LDFDIFDKTLLLAGWSIGGAVLACQEIFCIYFASILHRKTGHGDAI
jgi:hypothetical protein